MELTKIKRLFLAVIIALTSQSCQQDDEVIVDIEDSFTTETNEVPEMSANLMMEWTNLLVEIEQYSSGRPNASARAMAYIYLATYETMVPGMDGYVSNDEKLRGFKISNSERAEEISWEIALNACFSKVMDHFLLNLPSDYVDQIEVLEAAIESGLSVDFSNEVVSDSKEWGTYVANQVISYSQSDADAEQQILDPQPLSYDPPANEGYWTYSADQERALFPYWESVRTFVISPKETSSIPPIEYSRNENSAYFAEMMETYTVNNSAKEGDSEQLWIAEFWSDDVEGLMISPPVRQISIANQLIAQYGLGMEESLEMYLKLGFSLNDAAVATWKYKYEYMVMRPNVYIHEFIDPDYQTNLYRLVYWPNPSFPGYPSGHSCFASAAAGVFIDFLGNDTNFTDRTHEGRTEFQGAPRTFASFEDLAEENAFSRVPLGVHISMDCEEGLRLGYEISDAINNWNLNSNRSKKPS